MQHLDVGSFGLYLFQSNVGVPAAVVAAVSGGMMVFLSVQTVDPSTWVLLHSNSQHKQTTATCKETVSHGKDIKNIAGTKKQLVMVRQQQTTRTHRSDTK